jgi:hypothetical protein
MALLETSCFKVGGRKVPVTYLNPERFTQRSQKMFPDWGKRRLYLAFYYRGTPAKGYHVALLLTPKNPSKSTEAVAWRFHVKNVIENVDGTPKQVWIYEGAPTKTRSDRLSGLVFLSKIPSGVSGEKLNEVLKTVEVKQDDPEWRCKDWVIAAIQVLFLPGILISCHGA